MKEENENILFYEGQYYFLSNFSPFTVMWKGKLYPTSEQVYQSERFHNEKLKEFIRTTASTYEAYQYAQKNKQKSRSDWDVVKVEVMESVLREKVAQHPYIKELLVNTGDRLLLKNFEGDSFWGTGKNNEGQNMLGKLWMKIREDLRR